LDADYVLHDTLIDELRRLAPDADIAGYRVQFRYCIWGRPILSGNYPPVVVLYRRDVARYVQDGHTQRIEVHGKVIDLKNQINHDDRKPLSRWLDTQKTYTQLE